MQGVFDTKLVSTAMPNMQMPAIIFGDARAALVQARASGIFDIFG
jgi:hypothetical protein